MVTHLLRQPMQDTGGVPRRLVFVHQQCWGARPAHSTGLRRPEDPTTPLAELRILVGAAEHITEIRDEICRANPAPANAAGG